MGKEKLHKYSVLMTVYKKDNPEWLRQAIDSMLNQTWKPSEFVIIIDGPIPAELQCILDKYVKVNGDMFKIKPQKKNIGLGAALKIGVENCSYEYIARMDADDISAPKRCETILKYMVKHPTYSVTGCNAIEFVDNINNAKAIVKLPLNPVDARKFAKKRVPIRHPSIIIKKSDTLAVGNFKPLRRSQEYDLVVRMLMANMEISNVPEVLFYIRVGKDFYIRRGGWSKAKLLVGQRYDFYKYGFYSFPEFMLYAGINLVMCMMPNSLRAFIYQKFLRKPMVKGSKKNGY